MKKAKIAFLGGGNMATSLIAGLIKDGYDNNQIWVADRNESKRAMLASNYNIHTMDSINDAAKIADIIVLAVKPQNMAEAANEIRQTVKQRKPLIISVAAGIMCQSLENWFGQDSTIVRAMPNTPAVLQAGAAGMFANNNTSSAQKDLAEQILRASGVVVWLKKESLIDAVASVAGSGPAYYFLIMEIMQNIAIDMGIDSKDSELLAKQTIFGAAKMALESKDSVDILRQQVTSKGGSTEAALNSFADSDLIGTFEKALYASNKRAGELAKLFGGKQNLPGRSE